MNFRFTLKSTAIFLAGAVIAGATAAYFENTYAGLAILIGTVAYLANAEKPRR